MRSFGVLLSLTLHGAIITLALWGPSFMGPAIDLSVPVYRVNLVSLPAPPGPKKAGKPRAKLQKPKVAEKPKPPEPKPEPEPKPQPKPEPKPEPKAVPIKKPEPEKPEPKKPEPIKKPESKPEPKKPETKKPEPKAEPKPKPKKPEKTPEQVLAEALKAAEKKTARDEAKQRKALEDELAALRESVEQEDETEEIGGGGMEGGVEGGAEGLVAVYSIMVERIIKENWRFPNVAGREVLSCRVEINLDNSGNILNYTLLETSGRPDFDASALKAVDATKQLPPPPRPDLQVIRINFNLQDLAQ